jgi:hypothetical protein
MWRRFCLRGKAFYPDLLSQGVLPWDDDLCDPLWQGDLRVGDDLPWVDDPLWQGDPPLDAYLLFRNYFLLFGDFQTSCSPHSHY